jgi:hypothetical protein
VAERYPTAAAFDADLPNLLVRLGYERDRAEYLAANIVVEPARGSGHAWGAGMRSEKTHLRTRVESTGHELQGLQHRHPRARPQRRADLLAERYRPHPSQGVPNTAFTEAIAFVFQARDLELLGLAQPDPRNEALKTLDDFWSTFEMAGVSLVDMGGLALDVCQPEADAGTAEGGDPADRPRCVEPLFRPVFGARDVDAAGHLFAHDPVQFLYLPDYPIGFLIATRSRSRCAGPAKWRGKSSACRASATSPRSLDDRGDRRAGRRRAMLRRRPARWMSSNEAITG